MRRWWLLEVTIDGHTHRWAEADLEITTDDGDTLFYAAGLVDEIDVARGDPIAVTILDPAQDWGEHAPGLDRAECRLLRWTEGEVYERAEVYLNGEAVYAAYGTPREGCLLEIEEVLDEGLQMPDALARADAETWPLLAFPYVLPTEMVGIYYPIIFGMPGYEAGRGVPWTPVPAPLVQYNSTQPGSSYLAISDRPLPAAVTQVYALNTVLGEEGWEDVQAQTDGIGRKISVCDFANDTSPFPGGSTDKKGFYIGFHPDGGGGGQYRNAHEVITFVLREWAGKVMTDWSRMPDLEWLEAYQVDSWVNDATKAWDWIEAVLVPHLPIAIRHGPRGRYIERLRFDAKETDSLGVRDATWGEWERRGLIESERVQIANEFTGEFRPGGGGTYKAKRVLTATSRLVGKTYITDDERVLANPLCRASQSRYGLRPGAPVQLSWCWDEPTALRVLEDQAKRYALPRRTVLGWVADGDELQVGEVIQLTDEEVGLDQALAIVAEPPVATRGGAVIRFRLPTVL